MDPQDVASVTAQLGRVPRGLRGVAHRCPCGLPDVVETAPRLEDGSPFPTMYYLTCPRAASAIGTLESDGMMRDMTERLAADAELAARYRAAHEDYIKRRDAIEVLEGFPSAGGMPDRVKCLHVLVAHSLAAGPGVNPLGDEAIAALPEWWKKGPCVCAEPGAGTGSETRSGTGPATSAGTRPETSSATSPETGPMTSSETDSATGPATGPGTDSATGPATNSGTNSGTNSATSSATSEGDS